MQDRLRVMIVGNAFGFPNGYGATARVHSYAKGLVENGVAVKVVCLTATERPRSGVMNAEPQGIHDGVPFEYVCGTTFRPRSFLRCRWLDLKSAVRLWLLVSRIEKPNAVIVFSNSALWIILITAFSKLTQSKCIQEKSEFPFVYSKQGLWLKLYRPVYSRVVYKLFDAMIVISTYLEEYFSRHVRKGAQILRVPILVDVAQISESTNAWRSADPYADPYIVYVGSLGHADEITSLIDAFDTIAADFPRWKLLIVGDFPGSDILDHVKHVVKNRGLQNQVEFAGMVKRADLPRYLSIAKVFVLPRQAGIFSQAGFPTKLGEYLATGKPVIVTSTGDIPRYLEDGVSAYLVPPGDSTAFAERLKYVLSHRDVASRVGQRGQEIAAQSFDYRANMARVVNLINTL